MPEPDTPETEEAVAPAEPAAAQAAQAEPEPSAGTRRRDRRALVWVAIVVAFGIVIAQGFLVYTLLDTSNELSGLRDDVAAIGDRIGVVESGVGEVRGAVGEVQAGVGSVGQRLGALEVAATGASQQEGLSPAPAVEVDGPSLPRFDPNAPQDPAIGTVLAELGSLEFYSGEELLFDLGDGKARAILVWAHWCPFCQEELPPLGAWHASNSDAFENFELITITTAIDPAGDNPLAPYLEASGFTFPVLVDSTGELAAQLGASAFPFWVFTAPDGTVLGRIAGVIGEEQFVSLATQLDSIERAEDGGPTETTAPPSEE